eukprot:SM000192S04901  [mRNA]  locus=s192:62820:67277:- [translate_table: standard]
MRKSFDHVPAAGPLVKAAGQPAAYSGLAAAYLPQSPLKRSSPGSRHSSRVDFSQSNGGGGAVALQEKSTPPGATFEADHEPLLAMQAKPGSPKQLPTGAASVLHLSRQGRWQWVLLIVWVVACVKMMKDAVDAMDVSVRSIFVYEAFLYYNPLFMVVSFAANLLPAAPTSKTERPRVLEATPTRRQLIMARPLRLQALMVWLWGFNLYGFAHSRVSYPRVFDLDANHLTHWDIWKIAAGLTVLVLTSMVAYLHLYATYHLKNLAASQPVLLYCLLPLLLALPIDIFHAPSRYYFLGTLFRMMFPLQPITFADFFVADVLTSMAKVLSDVERAACRMANGQVATLAIANADEVCGSHSVMIPMVLAFPYVCRFFQCLRQYSDTKEKNCIYNALKYLSAFPVIFLSALKYRVPLPHWQSIYKPLWLTCSILNSCFAYYWDISRDWDLGLFNGGCNGKNPLLRNNLYYGRKWVYYWAMSSNLLLRASWTYKLAAHLRPNTLTVFIVSAVEMLRRFQWIFFRVENEWNKMTMRSAASQQSLRDLSAEEVSPLLKTAASGGSDKSLS